MKTWIKNSEIVNSEEGEIDFFEIRNNKHK
jgi:hypothetical protein